MIVSNFQFGIQLLFFHFNVPANLPKQNLPVLFSYCIVILCMPLFYICFTSI